MSLSGTVRWSMFIIVCILGMLIIGWIPQRNNVCKSLRDYMSINNNNNCWYNPDIESSVEQIIKRYGYKYEEHYVKSEDGYVLQLHRIRSKSNYGQNQPILLKSGMGGAPVFWLMQGSESVVFKLADKGYDIWLSTTRASTYTSRKEEHVQSEAKYWDFSFHEIGIFDIPALTTYIMAVTKNQSKIIYIGHSMSTTASYIYASEKKIHAENHLKGIISLAPTAYMRKVKGLFEMVAPKTDWIWPLSKILRWHAVCQYPITRKVIYVFCSQFPGIYGCYHFYAFASGLSPSEDRADLVPFFYKNMPTSISMKTLTHFGQMIQAGRFQKFDYKDDKTNLKKYNSTVPPEYDTYKIKLPVHLFVGKYDYNSPEEDVDLLYKKLKKNGVRTSKQIFNYAHSDFLMGKNIKMFYNSLFNVLEELSVQNK